MIETILIILDRNPDKNDRGYNDDNLILDDEIPD
jgi:hypothetical protein